MITSPVTSKVQPLLCLLAFFFTCIQSVATYANPAGSVELTTEEQQWLAEHPVIRLAPDPNFAPIEWFNQQNEYNGVSSDYVLLLEQRLGIRFEIVQEQSWNDILNGVKAGEIDALSASLRTTEREASLAFSKPYFSTQRALFSTRELDGVNSLEDLRPFKVAVVQGSWMDETLSSRGGLSINRFQDLATAMTATSLGVTDVVGSSIDTMAFTALSEGLTNLQLATTLPVEMQLAFAVNRELAPLAGIISKALDTVGAAEAQAIRDRWITQPDQNLLDNPIYRTTAMVIAGLLLLGITAILVWNRSLNHRVQVRSRQLEDAQMQLIQAEKMESVGRLSAGVAHEVKNPLAIIQMGTNYLSGVVPEELGVKEVIQDMDDAVERADSVIKELLDFSHSNKLALERGDINTLVNDTLHLVSHEYIQRHIELTSELASGLPPLNMDGNKIKQVLINMLMNAAQAIGQDGQVTVSSTLTSWGGPGDGELFQPGNPILRLSILDNGPGIDEEHLKCLFDPFFSTKPVGEGTGLGLSVSRNIVELHGGRLTIVNAPAGGALVTMDFKLDDGDIT